MKITAFKGINADSTEMHIAMENGKMYIDKVRKNYQDGTNGNWQEVKPPKKLNLLSSDCIEKIEKEIKGMKRK